MPAGEGQLFPGKLRLKAHDVGRLAPKGSNVDGRHPTENGIFNLILGTKSFPVSGAAPFPPAKGPAEENRSLLSLVIMDNAKYYEYNDDLTHRRISAFLPRLEKKAPFTMKIAVAHIKTRIATLGQSVRPKIGLVISLVVGFFNPHAFENDYFILLILLLGILGLLIHDADPPKNAAVNTAGHQESTHLKALKPSAVRGRNGSG